MIIGLLGLGNLGGGVYEMLSARDDIQVKYVLCQGEHERIEATVVRDIQTILNDREVDTVVELVGGLETGFDFVSRSLKAGKHVVTANKHLIHRHQRELLDLAREKGVFLRFTAAAGGGISWLTALERCKRADTIHEVTGIFNGTTNYILDTMHNSPVSFQAALGRAQDFGYAEKEAAFDLDGKDSLIKLVISANVAFNANLDPDQVLVRGIRGIQRRDVETFQAHGYVCRLLGSAEHYANSLAAVVEPTLVEQQDLEAAVHSYYNLLTFISRHAGRQSFYGHGAGRYPAAYNVVQDLLDIASGRLSYTSGSRDVDPIDNRTFVRQYYIRTSLSEPWLWSRTEERWQTGVITCRLPAPEMHAWAAEARLKDPELFFAALR